MKTNNLREEILKQPSYWVESINGYMYDAIVSFMEKNKMKQKDLAAHLNISTGRVSQILNSGEINFSIEKLIEISIKIGKVPSFNLIDFDSYLKKDSEQDNVIEFPLSNEFFNWTDDTSTKKTDSKIISIYPLTENSISIAL